MKEEITQLKNIKGLCLNKIEQGLDQDGNATELIEYMNLYIAAESAIKEMTNINKSVKYYNTRSIQR